MWLRFLVDKLQEVLALPVLILGSICLVIMLLGQWLRRIANQTSEEGERMVEAQFAAQTKALKQRYIADDQAFLAERVVAPELSLRALDDHDQIISKPVNLSAEDLLKRADDLIVPGNILAKKWSTESLGNSEEMIFLRNVALLHRDYQDSGLFRPTDTKMTTQLLGNLALADLKHRAFGRTPRESRQLRALDTSRSGSLVGWPLPLVQLHDPHHHGRNGQTPPRLQPPCDTTRASRKCTDRNSGRVSKLAGALTWRSPR